MGWEFFLSHFKKFSYNVRLVDFNAAEIKLIETDLVGNFYGFQWSRKLENYRHADDDELRSWTIMLANSCNSDVAPKLLIRKKVVDDVETCQLFCSPPFLCLSFISERASQFM